MLDDIDFTMPVFVFIELCQILCVGEKTYCVFLD